MQQDIRTAVTADLLLTLESSLYAVIHPTRDTIVNTVVATVTTGSTWSPPTAKLLVRVKPTPMYRPVRLVLLPSSEMVQSRWLLKSRPYKTPHGIFTVLEPRIKVPAFVIQCGSRSNDSL